MKLQEQGAPPFLPSRACHFGPFQHGSLQERRLCKNRSHQLAGSKMVLRRYPARIISFGQLVSSCHRLQHLRLRLNRDCTGKKVILRSCSDPPVFPRRSTMQWQCFVLGTVPVLPRARVPVQSCKRKVPWSYKKQRQVDSNSLLRISCRRSRSKVPLLFFQAMPAIWPI